MAKTKSTLIIANQALKAFDEKLKELCPKAISPQAHMPEFREQFVGNVLEYVTRYMRNMK